MSRGTLTDIANTLVDEFGSRETIVDDVDEVIVDAIRGAVALRAVADDALARLTSQAERVGVATRAGMSMRELLCVNGVAPALASRLIRLGHAIHVLPRLARHSRDATLSAEHLDAVARGIGHVATRLHSDIDSEVIDGVEATLIGSAVAGLGPAEIVEQARAIAIENTQPDGDDPDHLPPAEDATLNELDWSKTGDGRLRGQFDLDALTAERFISALDRPSRPRPEPDGSDDPRSASRRRADAFGQLLECGTRGLLPGSRHRPPRTEVILTIPTGATGDGEPGDGAARLQWTGPITEFTAKRAACDASITGIGLDINGAPPRRLDHSASVHRSDPQTNRIPGPGLREMWGTAVLDRLPPHRSLRRRRTHHRRQRLSPLPFLSHCRPPRRLGRRHGCRPASLADTTGQRGSATTTTPVVQPKNHETRRPRSRLTQATTDQIELRDPTGTRLHVDNFTV